MDTSKYNFKTIEEKWQNFWTKNNFFASKTDEKKKKILLPRNVSIPIWQNTYGSCKKLYNR